jgi:hypothetical protein
VAITAAPEAQARLLDLQGLDTRLSQLARREQTLPERAALETIATERITLAADLSASTGTLEDAQTELRRVESDVAVVQARIARDGERMLQTSSAKDASAFEHEVQTLQKRQSDLEDIELAVMERVEQHQAAVDALAGALAELDDRREAAQAAVAVALTELQAERVQVTADRAAIAAALPADLLALYERQRERYGVGASLLSRGMSQASGVALLADELARIRAAAPEDVLICPSSEAILVRTAESGL